MRHVSITDLKARLSEQIRYVRGGHRVVVLDRGTPVAILAPLDPGDLPEDMIDLTEQGLVRPPVRPLPGDFLQRRRPDDPDSKVRAAVLEERDAGW